MPRTKQKEKTISNRERKHSKNHTYLNWPEADLSTINEDEFAYFENHCEQVNSNEPELVNRLNFRPQMEEILSKDENVNLLRNFSKKSASVSKVSLLSDIFESFYFVRDVNHWLLKFNRGMLLHATFVIDAFEMKLHPFDDYAEIAWEDFSKAHLLKQAELGWHEELEQLRETVPNWKDEQLRLYWEEYKDDPDFQSHVAIIRAERRKRAGIN